MAAGGGNACLLFQVRLTDCENMHAKPRGAAKIANFGISISIRRPGLPDWPKNFMFKLVDIKSF